MRNPRIAPSICVRHAAVRTRVLSAQRPAPSRLSRALHTVTCAVVFCLAGVVGVHAQPVSTSARQSGLAFSGDALMTGVDGIGINPAAISLPRTPVVSIALAPFGMRAGTDFLEYSLYRKYFTGVEGRTGREPYQLTSADKRVLLDAFDGPTGTVSAGAGVRLVAVSVRTPIGSFGLNMDDRIVNEVLLPRDYADFLLNGNPPGRTFDFGQTRLTSSWHREYGLSYAQSVAPGGRRGPILAFGATVKFLQGFGYFAVERFNSRFTTDPDSFVVTGHAGILARYAGVGFVDGGSPLLPQLFPTLSGAGFGLDAGALLMLSDVASLSLALTDLGTITWSRGAKESRADEEFRINDLSTDEQVQDIIDRVNGHERSIDRFSTVLPTTISLAGSYILPHTIGGNRPLRLAAAVRTGLTSSPLGGVGARMSLGAEWSVFPSVSLRTGISFGDRTGTVIGAGIGLRLAPVTLDLSTHHVQSLFTSNFTTISFAAGLRLDFPG